MTGIDVAKWNEIKNYNALRTAGIDFAIVKVINKQNKPDERFEEHLTGFAQARIPVIAGYNYLYTVTPEQAEEAAHAAVSAAAGRIPMIYADLEDAVLRKLPKDQLTAVVKAYRRVIEEAGIQFGIYCNLDWYMNVLDADELGGPFWIAKYGKNTGCFEAGQKPSIRHPLYGWQYTSRGRVTGVSGDVDKNVWYAETESVENMNMAGSFKGGYSREQFMKEMAQALGLPDDTAQGTILKKTVSISTKKNRGHACVTPLERYMKLFGYYNGKVEADYGQSPVFGNGMAKATKLYQTMQVGLKKPDGEWTKQNASYRKALGIS